MNECVMNEVPISLHMLYVQTFEEEYLGVIRVVSWMWDLDYDQELHFGSFEKVHRHNVQV